MTDAEMRDEIRRLAGLLRDPHSLDVTVRTMRWLLEAEAAEGELPPIPPPPAPEAWDFDPHDTL